MEQVIPPLHAAAVGVLSRVKRAGGAGHLPQDIVRSFLRGVQVGSRAGRRIGRRVGQDQQRVVVQ